jgi:hypothetical protein
LAALKAAIILGTARQTSLIFLPTVVKTLA